MDKLQALKDYLQELGSVAVAFSSGVDSTFLLKVAHDTLGDKAIAVTAKSCSFPKRELEEATAFCKAEGIKLLQCGAQQLSGQKHRRRYGRLRRRWPFGRLASLSPQRWVPSLGRLSYRRRFQPRRRCRSSSLSYHAPAISPGHFWKGELSYA